MNPERVKLSVKKLRKESKASQSTPESLTETGIGYVYGLLVQMRLIKKLYFILKFYHAGLFQYFNINIF